MSEELGERCTSKFVISTKDKLSYSLLDNEKATIGIHKKDIGNRTLVLSNVDLHSCAI